MRVFLFFLTSLILSFAHAESCGQGDDISSTDSSVIFEKVGRIGRFTIEVGRPHGSNPTDIEEVPSWARVTETGKPKSSHVAYLDCILDLSGHFSIKNGQLIASEAQYDRYSPDEYVSTTPFKLDSKGHFTKLKKTSRNPFVDLQDRFSKSLKKGDLPAILKQRNQLIHQWNYSYSPEAYAGEIRAACFNSVKKAYEKAIALKDRSKAAKILLPFLTSKGKAEEGDEDNGDGRTTCEFVYSLKKDEYACSNNEAACQPPEPADIGLVNNLAFLLQQGGENSKALLLLKSVLRASPDRAVAYVNLADTYDALKKPSVALLARIVADTLKKPRTEMKPTELGEILKVFKVSCPVEKLKGSVEDAAGKPQLTLVCEGLENPVLDWNFELETPVLSQGEIPKLCPMTKRASKVTQPVWTNFKERDSNRSHLSDVAHTCLDVTGAIALDACKWVVACAGGVDSSDKETETSRESVVDFVEVDEIRKTVKPIARSSAMEIKTIPSMGGFKAEDSMSFNTVTGKQKYLVGEWNFKCDTKSCAPTYTCHDVPNLKFDHISFQHISDDFPDVDSLNLLVFLATNGKDSKITEGTRYPFSEYWSVNDPLVMLDASAIRKNRSACTPSMK